ncbi:hypothetical protein EYZ11_002326 [Aspergillus tanneri]|uniref:Uncharacterized protein n=1 Tax=Aspergillus tanneri TaxID=1220188 RepID=A0A4S3JRS1_9EURO|nr:uncharacterized protein ATNIH1004_010061 [Aspergillus tanneri]KAA8643294.1 hypothetical protein ATNIH1004_010061 [Aspergillus tanneri]THC98170.1 hypothetical protein EYZ11_002326 [Aspergillus tanneri]
MTGDVTALEMTEDIALDRETEETDGATEVGLRTAVTEIATEKTGTETIVDQETGGALAATDSTKNEDTNRKGTGIVTVLDRLLEMATEIDPEHLQFEGLEATAEMTAETLGDNQMVPQIPSHRGPEMEWT